MVQFSKLSDTLIIFLIIDNNINSYLSSGIVHSLELFTSEIHISSPRSQR